MIWGTTHKEDRQFREKIKAKKKLQSGKFYRHFAWFPVWLNDGRTLWLGWYECRKNYSWSNSGCEYVITQQRTCL